MESSERLDISDNSWRFFAAPLYGRFNATMIGVEGVLYLVGGFPVEFVGRSIERYLISENRWEGVNITIPHPTANAGLVRQGPHGFLILGGRFSQTVFNVDLKDGFKLYKSYKHDTPIETEIPPIEAQNRGVVYVLRSQSGRMPQVVSLPLAKLLEKRKIKRTSTLNKSTIIYPLENHILRGVRTPEYASRYM
jgi:hypothetical protein